jgi:putative hydrolase of HD superfamily
MNERLTKQLSFIMEIDKLKTVSRRTLVHDKSRQETDAEHSWHFAMMALVLLEYSAEEGVDVHRVIRMALVHDLVEIYAGDTFAYDTKGYEDKEEREQAAADRLFSLLPADQAAEYRGLWEEFDAMESADARYAAAVDRLQPLLNNHITDGYTWEKYGVSAEQIYARMQPLRESLPALWGFVEQAVREAKEKGKIP